MFGHLQYKILTPSFVKCTAEHFILSAAIIDYFLISFLDCSLLDCRNTICFFLFVCFFFVLFIDLVSCSLTEPFVSSNRVFFVDSLGFHVYKSMSFANRGHFTFSFSIWMPFTYFSYLIAMARTSSTILNRDGKSRPLCFLPYFRSEKHSVI